VWWCLQGRGTQQGGSHSPTLFGRVLAGRFEQLSAQWTSRGEIPAFVTPLLAVWALWFIDDSIFLFRTVPQLRRLMPEVLAMLAALGLSVNVSKSCILGAFVPRSLPGLLGTFPIQTSSKYLGMPLQLVEGDAYMVDSLCARATAAYFANRLLLTHVSAPRGRRVRMFNSLVTASLRWSLCVASVNQVNLRKLRVHHVTLLAWMLGARRHPSWFVVQCIAALRHAVKLWAWVYAERWDLLLARMVSKWVGHVLRFPADHVVRQTLLGLQHSSVSRGIVRRQRTGPKTVAIEMFFATFITMGSISPQLVIAWHGNLWNMIGLLLMDCPLTGYLARIYFQFPLSLSCGRNAAYKGLFTDNKFLRVMFLIQAMLSLWNWIGFLAGVAKGVITAVSPSPPFCRMWLILDGFALALFM
jgi:hypothetical protein